MIRIGVIEKYQMENIVTTGRSANCTAKNIKPQLLIERFIENSKAYPDKAALIDADGSVLSYKETAARAARFAAALKKAGAGHGDRVAISLSRGSDQVCAVLGVLLIGGVYVPLSLSQPIERRRGIYKKADIHFCITRDASSSLQIENCVNIDSDNIDNESDYTIDSCPAQPSDSAYIIFTSGSTGTPKGVEITHASANNTICDIIDRLKLGEQDIAIAVSSLNFDLSVFDIFGMLSCGGSLVLLSDEIEREASSWIGLIESYKVTIWNSVPALFEMLMVSLGSQDKLESLRIALISGDRIPPSLVALMRKHTDNCRFVALGGATEASIWSNYYEVEQVMPDWELIPYGWPLANQRYRVIANGRDADDFEIGELWIGGDGLALGYVNDPERTAEAFVSDNGERWYKTGDLGYYQPDDCLIFVGRNDTQVKINGYRVELGEIEANISRLEGIGKAVSVVVGKSSLAAAIETAGETVTEDFANAPVVFRADCREDLITADFMRRVLNSCQDISALPRENRPIIDLWNAYLNGVGELTEIPVERIPETKVELMRSILSGEISELALLDDDLLSPERLMLASEMNRLIEKIAGSIMARFSKSNKLIRIALMYGRSGELYERLLDILQASAIVDRLEFIYVESSNALIDSARKRYEKYNIDIKYARSDNNTLSGEYAGTHDAVVAINGLHQFHSVLDGLAWVKLWLKDGGLLYAAEPEKMTSFGLLSAAVIESGFAKYENSRRYSPMLSCERWCEAFEKSGLTVESAESIFDNYYVYEARQNTSLLNDDRIKAGLEKRLVPYMIPESYIYALKLPLSANGKLDRKTIASWFSEKLRSGSDPETDCEIKLAALWCELLNIKRVYREDSFFEIGGDSLLMTRMLSALRTNFGINITMKEAFDSATLAELAKLIRDRSGDLMLEEGEL